MPNEGLLLRRSGAGRAAPVPISPIWPPLSTQDQEHTAIMIERRLRAHRSLILASACPATTRTCACARIVCVYVHACTCT